LANDNEKKAAKGVSAETGIQVTINTSFMDKQVVHVSRDSVVSSRRESQIRSYRRKLDSQHSNAISFLIEFFGSRTVLQHMPV